jgi:hypothetical protein
VPGQRRREQLGEGCSSEVRRAGRGRVEVEWAKIRGKSSKQAKAQGDKRYNR